MSLLPPPPTHMQPGSPDFIEWMRQLSEYISRLASRPNYSAVTRTFPTSICCIPITETTIASVDIEERIGDIISMAFYLGSWQPSASESDSYDYYLRLKRNRKVVRTLRGGFNRSGWDGDDRNVHGIHYHKVDADADAEWSISLVLDDVDGSYPTINGFGLVAQVR